MLVEVRFPDSLLEQFDRAKQAAVLTTDDMLAAGNAACNKIYDRTAIEGKDRFGQTFPPYSTTPMYVGAEPKDVHDLAAAAGGRTTYLDPKRKRLTGKLTRLGKPSRTGTMKSVFLVGGYAMLKAGAAAVGRAGAGLVNLILTGKLMGSTGVFYEGKGDAAYEVTQAGLGYCELGFTRAEQALIADGLIERGRDFWGIGAIPEEKEMLADVLVERLAPRIGEALR